MDSSTKDSVPPIFENRKVLLEHLQAKIRSIKPNSCAEELANEVSKDLPDKEIIAFLENEEALALKIECSKSCQNVEKESLGEVLFVAVSEIDSELCAQVTGMLLELDVNSILDLLKSPELIKNAVYRAKLSYLNFTKNKNESIIRCAIGEELFELVLERYPEQEVASKLTGMLLELNVETLQRLISTSSELEEKLQVAHSALLQEDSKDDTETCNS